MYNITSNVIYYYNYLLLLFYIMYNEYVYFVLIM